MDVYGLTGGIGSGKSAVAQLLEEYGIPVVSADELARIVVAPGTEGHANVVEAFGEAVLGENGELDRRKMATIVFNDPEKRKQLEGLLHPRIHEHYEQILDALEKGGHSVVVYEVPLLFEKGLQGDMKGVVLVTTDEQTRIARVCARDGSDPGSVRARMAAQMDEETKRRKADYIIENDGDLDDLRREVEFLLSRYLRIDRNRRRPVSERANPTPASKPPPPPGPQRAKRSQPPPPPGAGASGSPPAKAGPPPPPPPGTSPPKPGPSGKTSPPPPPSDPGNK